MIKKGVIDENTPPEVPQPDSKCCGGRCRPPVTKQAADAIEDSSATRASNAVTEAIKSPASGR